MQLTLGTRGSALALAQAEAVAARLRESHPGLHVAIEAIRTSGDQPAGEASRSAPAPDDKSRFVKEIEEALLAGGIDLAVHSAKDVPGDLPDGLAVVGVPERADPRDSLCGARSLGDLHEGSVVGTSSLRRRSQLLAGRPDLRVEELHGNVDTRLARLENGDYAALILAAAGLARLERPAGAPLGTDEFVPAPGQGCLMLEARADDDRARELAEALVDQTALLELTAERALVGALGATCRTPVGAHAAPANGRLTLAAYVGLPDGSVWIRDSIEGPAEEPAALGREAADRLLTAGAAELLAVAESWSGAG